MVALLLEEGMEEGEWEVVDLEVALLLEGMEEENRWEVVDLKVGAWKF